MHLQAVEAVVHALVAPRHRELTGVGGGGARVRGGREPPSRRREQRGEIAHAAGGSTARRCHHLDLPDGLEPRPGVHAVQRRIDDARVFERRDLALPDVEVDEHVLTVEARQSRRVRQERLREVTELLVREVLGEHSVDVDAPRRNRDVRAGPRPGPRQLEPIGRRRPRDGRVAEDVVRLLADAAPQDLDRLVPVRVELDAALLHEQGRETAVRLVADAAVVPGHGALSFFCFYGCSA